MESNLYPKTACILKRNNLDIDYVIHDKSENIMINDCFTFEKSKQDFLSSLSDDIKNNVKKNHRNYIFFHEIKNLGYKTTNKISFILSKTAVLYHNPLYDYTILDRLLLSDDLDGKIWNEFLESEKKYTSIISKYLPQIDDFVDIRLSTMQKIILSLYENECSMKEIVTILNKHKRISNKYSSYSIRKFVHANTLFFLYWGIIEKRNKL